MKWFFIFFRIIKKLMLKGKKVASLKSFCNGASDHSIYTVQEGETLKEIALSFGCTDEKNIIACNNIQDKDSIFAGKRIKIPFHYYTVKKGDTVYSVALAYQIAHWDLWASHNGLFKKDGYKIEEGQKLKIWI